MPEYTSEIFLLQKNVWICLSAPTKKTIIYFPWTGISFFVLEFGKIQLQSEKRYLIGVLSTNKIAEYKRLKDERNTVKHCSEKSKCCVAMCLKKNSWSSSFSSLSKTWNLLSIVFPQTFRLLKVFFSYFCLCSANQVTHKVLIFLLTITFRLACISW